MSANNNHLQTVLDYIKTVQNRISPEDIIRYYHPDVIQTEYPNAITKNTTHRNLQALREAAARGSKVMQKEEYEIIHSYVTGNTVILETIWTGALAVSIGQLPVGGQMKAHFAQFFELQDGKITRQRNYDCFEPFM